MPRLLQTTALAITVVFCTPASSELISKDTERALRDALYDECRISYPHRENRAGCEAAANEAVRSLNCAPFETAPPGLGGGGDIAIQSRCAQEVAAKREKIERERERRNEPKAAKASCVPMETAVEKAQAIAAASQHWTSCEAAIYVFKHCNRLYRGDWFCGKRPDSSSISKNCSLSGPVCDESIR